MTLRSFICATAFFASVLGTACAIPLDVVEPASADNVYDKNSNIYVAGQTSTTYQGSTMVFKIRDGHVLFDADSGTIRQSDSGTISNEGQAGKTLSPPSGGWPTQMGADMPYHAEVKITVSGEDHRCSQNFSIEQEWP